MLGLLGMATAVQACIGYVLALELVPLGAQIWTGCCTHALDGLNVAFCTFYFVVISRYWEPY